MLTHWGNMLPVLLSSSSVSSSLTPCPASKCSGGKSVPCRPPPSSTAPVHSKGREGMEGEGGERGLFLLHCAHITSPSAFSLHLHLCSSSSDASPFPWLPWKHPAGRMDHQTQGQYQQQQIGHVTQPHRHGYPVGHIMDAFTVM